MSSFALLNTTAECNLSPFPKYVVNASKAAHVAEAVKFASRTGVRVIVKGGAHDLLGRCVQFVELLFTVGVNADDSFRK